MTALHTEVAALGIALPARRALDLKPSAALDAEQSFFGVVSLALWAFHFIGPPYDMLARGIWI